MPALVIDGHPDPQSLSAAVASAYARGHGDALVLAVRDLDFDPNLRFGYRQRMELEPDLQRAWSLIEAADHIVVVTPIWWGSVPALLKGFLDRTLLPHRVLRYRASGMVEGLLRGRTGRVIVLSDSPRVWLRLMGDTTVRQLRRSTLGLTGIRPVRLTRFGPVKKSTAAKREAWLARITETGRRDRHRRGAGSRPARPVG